MLELWLLVLTLLSLVWPGEIAGGTQDWGNPLTPGIASSVNSIVLYNGEIGGVLYLSNEPFERTWRILIWRLRRGYYSNEVVSTRKL